ncbi:MAG: hypothetical protein ACE5JM_18070 [Armatimonadota bacterium]
MTARGRRRRKKKGKWRRGKGEPRWRRGVAPRELIRLDFKNMLASEVLRCTWHVEELLFVQSIEGHAHEGHAEFKGHRFVNTNIADIVVALGFSRGTVAAHRQQLIDDVFRWVDEVIEGAEHDQLLDADGEPFFGMSMFRGLTVDPKSVLQGIYIGGRRDNVDVRRQVEEQFGIQVGGGASYFVDVPKLQEMGLDGREVAQGDFESQIEHFKEIGLIVPEDVARKRAGTVRYMYIRHRKGCGHSDDAAVLTTGMLHGFSAGVGAFVADAIDTIEKYVTHPADRDEELAEMIESRCPDLGVGPEDVLRVSRLAADQEDVQFDMPDCSLRHFLRVDREVDQNAIESHFLYLQDMQMAEMEIGHERVSNYELYEFLEGKVEER